MLLIPAHAFGQQSERISLLDNFGSYEKGQHLFIIGKVANIQPENFLIIETFNPDGDLCQIQQISPLSNGIFITESVPLDGVICGISGTYQIKVFYGDHSTEASFEVLSSRIVDPSVADYLENAETVVSTKMSAIEKRIDMELSEYRDRLENIVSSSQNTIVNFEELYVDLMTGFYTDEDLFETNPAFRFAFSEALDSTEKLVADNKLSKEKESSIKREIFSALFYYEIGNDKKSIDNINDVFVSIKNIDPIKVTPKKQPSFEEIEETLLNLMTKTHSVMSKPVKEEIAFIFSRGTGPLYTEELENMLKLLSEARYLDVVSRKQSPLYRIVHSEWETTSASLTSKESMSELLELKPKVDKVHEAAIIIRNLEDVEMEMSSEKEDSEIVSVIRPEWNSLSNDLELATSVDDIIESKERIEEVRKTVEISSRLSKIIEISRASQADTGMEQRWEKMLVDLQETKSTDEILSIVSEFEKSINELREKRDPLSLLKFEYQNMKQKAELQSDQENLYEINNALRIIETAQQMQDGNPTKGRIDTIEVLLSWASQKAPEIKTELDSYSKDVYKIKAGDILQRAQSIENLVDLSLRKNKFLPGYIDFTNSMKEDIDEVRNLVIQNDLEVADNNVRQLFKEWREVNNAYVEDPYGSEVGYTKDELKRIEYREKLESYSNMVSNFYHPEFEPHVNKFEKMTDDTYELIDYGNFIDAESNIQKIGEYLSNNLVQKSDKIIYDISYNAQKDIWILQGAVDTSDFDQREDLDVTIYNMEGDVHSTLEFSDTKYGEFYTQWHAPTEAGLYVVMLHFQNNKATQIVNVSENIEQDHPPIAMSIAEVSRDFEELETFMEKFGENYQSNPRISSIISDIKISLSNKKTEQAEDKVTELKKLIERYLPKRSRSAVIEAHYENDKLLLSGAVQKTLSFREDLFIDVFNQKGKLVESINIKDSSSGIFNKSFSKPLMPGIYVAQLQYHDTAVNDFFTVK